LEYRKGRQSYSFGSQYTFPQELKEQHLFHEFGLLVPDSFSHMQDLHSEGTSVASSGG
jgi:hypothetical protein